MTIQGSTRDCSLQKRNGFEERRVTLKGDSEDTYSAPYALTLKGGSEET